MEELSIFDYNKARHLMTNTELDALVAISPENVLYTSGCYIHTQKLIRDRLAMTVLPKDGEPTFIVCNIEESLAIRESWIKDIRAYVEFETSPVDLLADVLKEKGLQGRRLGIDKMYIQVDYFQRLVNQMPDTIFEGNDYIFSRMRMLKTPKEINLLQKAAIATERSIHAGFEISEEGDNERSIALSIGQNMMRLGADQIEFLVVATGNNTAVAHHTPGEKKIKKGDIIRTDIGGTYSNYLSDVVRMAVVGKPSEKQKKIYEKLVSIQREIIENMQPGVQACSLFNLCKKKFNEAGFTFYMPHIGHGLGMMVHEEPIIHPFNKETLQENMLICIEPIHFIPGIEGYHIEDLVAITKDGAKILSNYTNTDEMVVIR